MTSETRKMFEIIHENCKKQREFNKKHTKRMKTETIINNILMVFGSGIFLFGIMFLVAVIENCKF